MRRCLLVVTSIALLAASAPAAAEAKRKKPTVTLRSAATATAGTAVTFSARAKAAKRRKLTRYTLRFGDGSSVRRGKKVKRKISHTYMQAGTYIAKLTVTDNRGKTAGAKAKITVAPRAVAPSPPYGQPTPPPPPPAVPPAPLELDAAAVELVTGSAALLPLPAPLAAVTSIDTPQGPPDDIVVSVDDGALSVAARAGTHAQGRTVTATGRACTATGCGHPLTLRVPVTVRDLAAPPGELKEFTSPSPDRVAAAKPLQDIAGSTLQDELLITLGTPDDPGTRTQADAAAALAGGIVSAGIDSIGVFEVRWAGPQDLQARRAQLLAADNVAAVSDTNLGVAHTDAAPPGDWNDDGDAVKWPFETTRTTQAWDQSSGGDVTVGIVDEGQVFAEHEDLNVTKKIGSNPPEYHATHVAGTACARANGKGLVGFGWGCPIVTSGWNDGSDKQILSAVKAVADAGAKVINLSLSYGGCALQGSWQSAALKAASNYKLPFRQYMRGEGRDVVFTVSAGNNCAVGVASPWGLNADLGNVISVAAINSDKSLAFFSSFGEGVEVAAPGGRHIVNGDGTVAIWSTLFEHCYLGIFRCDSYGYRDEKGALMEGTSMAAPAVAGIVALVRSEHPGYGASRAAGCVTGSAGTTVGSVTQRSTVGLPKQPNGQPVQLPVPYTGTIPIVNAQAAVECRSVQFSGTVGTGPPPATLGGYPMTSFSVDDRSLGEPVTEVSDPAGTILLSPAVTHYRIGSGWATWSHGYTGDVYFSGYPASGTDPRIDITLPSGTKAFAFYAEPNAFAGFSVEAIASDGTSSEPVNIHGQSGARYFGFYGVDGRTISSIAVTASDPRGFAIGEFGISR